MTRKIFRSILLVAGVVLVAGMVIMTGCLYSYFGGVQEQQLQDELSLAVSGVENGGTAYLERLPAERFRLTWIASDGRVLYDTQVTDVASMENHAGRQEVQEALKNGSGESSRYSDTLLQQTLYVARRLTDGTVLRISVSRATAGMLALGMLQPMLVVLAAALMIYALVWGDEAASRTFRASILRAVVVCSLGFYCLAKSYSFFTGANHLHSIISPGTPGNILSGGLILPLNVAVGLVVCCTMYSFYMYFRRGEL